MASFSGEYLVSIDSKGRVAVPFRLRAVASEQGTKDFVLNKGYDGCLVLYSDVDWKTVEEQVKSKKPILTEQERVFNRDFFEHVTPAPTDRQGRVLISAALLREAELDKEVLFKGVGDKIEIWNRKVYQKYRQDFKMSREQVAEQRAKDFE